MTPSPSVAWRPGELRALAALAVTFVDGDSPEIERRASLAADALTRAADPAQVTQLRLLLRALGSRLGTLALTGRGRAFPELAVADRERILLAWAASPIPLRRSAVAAFRKLLTFLAYADPGPGGDNPRWWLIGYVRDEPPQAAELTPIRPTVVAAGEGSGMPSDEPIRLDADVVVVGSGAGGGVVAAALAEAGRAVVVLEAGPFVDEASMPRDELDAYSRLYLNHGLLSTWDGAVTLLAGSGVGGGTLVNWMTTIDAPPAVRAEWAVEHGLDGVDGAEWEADRAAIETELGAQPSFPVPPKDDALLRGAAALDWEAGPTIRNGGPCDDCGSCPFGCRRGSKRSGIRVHLARAHAAGARIVPRVRVLRVVVEAGRVVGVAGNALVTDPGTGEPIAIPGGQPGEVRVRPIEVHAQQVVLAAGALRTPAIVQLSGIGGRSVGRHLRIHPVPVVAGLFDSPIDTWRGPSQAARSLEFAAPGPGRHGYVIESAPGHPGLIALAMPWEGRARHAELMGRARGFGPFIAITRDGGAGRLTLTRAGRVRIDYRLDATGVATLRHALVSMARLARAAGAPEIVALGSPAAWFDDRASSGPAAEREFEVFLERLGRLDFGSNRGAVFSAHQMGSLRCGADPASHPADARGRVRADAAGRLVGGLYVADASTFPTGLGVNPMLTVMAMAHRVSRTVLDESPGG